MRTLKSLVLVLVNLFVAKKSVPAVQRKPTTWKPELLELERRDNPSSFSFSSTVSEFSVASNRAETRTESSDTQAITTTQASGYSFASTYESGSSFVSGSGGFESQRYEVDNYSSAQYTLNSTARMDERGMTQDTRSSIMTSVYANETHTIMAGTGGDWTVTTITAGYRQTATEKMGDYAYFTDDRQYGYIDQGRSIYTTLDVTGTEWLRVQSAHYTNGLQDSSYRFREDHTYTVSAYNGDWYNRFQRDNGDFSRSDGSYHSSQVRDTLAVSESMWYVSPDGFFSSSQSYTESFDGRNWHSASRYVNSFDGDTWTGQSESFGHEEARKAFGQGETLWFGNDGSYEMTSYTLRLSEAGRGFESHSVYTDNGAIRTRDYSDSNSSRDFVFRTSVMGWTPEDLYPAVRDDASETAAIGTGENFGDLPTGFFGSTRANAGGGTSAPTRGGSGVALGRSGKGLGSSRISLGSPILTSAPGTEAIDILFAWDPALRILDNPELMFDVLKN